MSYFFRTILDDPEDGDLVIYGSQKWPSLCHWIVPGTAYEEDR
jgi:hypothetical protein